MININQPHKDTLRISGEEIKKIQHEYDKDVTSQLMEINKMERNIAERIRYIATKRIFEAILARVGK